MNKIALSFRMLVEIDEDDGCLWDDPELSTPYRDETREYVQACLGLPGELNHDRFSPTNATIQAFESVGTAIRDAYNYGIHESLPLVQPTRSTAPLTLYRATSEVHGRM